MWVGRIYVAALCSPCNLRITLKLNYLKIYGHNATRYDNHLVLNGITDEFKVVNMIAKSGENLIKISIKNKEENMRIKVMIIGMVFVFKIP